jgi:hypothetical protein
MGRLIRRWKRRKPGVYAYRTRRHTDPRRTEWGYIGKARNLDARGECHAGKCRHDGCHRRWQENGIVGAPWYDLVVRRYTIELPWWLGFDWITLSLESILIAILRPRYNDQKNSRRSKVRRIKQVRQRRERDAWTEGYRFKVAASRLITRAIQIVGVLLIIVGIGGYLWTRS